MYLSLSNTVEYLDVKKLGRFFRKFRSIIKSLIFAVKISCKVQEMYFGELNLSYAAPLTTYQKKIIPIENGDRNFGKKKISRYLSNAMQRSPGNG